MGRLMPQRQLRITLKSLLCLVPLSLVAIANAQWAPLNPVTAVKQQSDGVLFDMKTGTLKLQVCTDSIIRVRYSATSAFSNAPDYVVIKNNWPETKWSMQSAGDDVILTTSRLKVTVTGKDGAITYHDLDGNQLFQEASRKLTPVKVNGEDTYRAESFVSIYGSHEALYGLGQHQAGVWNYRGESVDISQDNSNISIPLLVSSKGYGIFWNNDSRSRFNNRFANYLYVSSEVADNIDYYFFYGPDFDRIIAAYRELTGPAPMFGKWAYGFWQCKNRYKSQDEILGIARKYRELHIPVDNIVQDWFWWNRKGEHVFNKNYPDPKEMVDELHRENFHLMISVWPFFEPGSAVYDDMEKRGWFVDQFKFAKPPYHTAGMAVYDATNPEARKYYWQLMDKALFDIGIDAWSLDTTEPETEGQEENILLHHKLAIGSGDRYVNIYPLMTTGAVYEGQRSTSDKKRVFILSRSAFAGDQRYGVTAWSGDINSDFLTFRRQIPAGLNFALSGIPYWTTDIGGFVSGDQFMFGPAFLVNPMTEAGATTRRLYLPQSRWYDFWTGSAIAGGRTLEADAPLERLPLYIRAGSILPMGPDEEWSTEKPANPIELRIYRGADVDFTLYEDENDNYNYEKGAYTTIPFHWDDTKRTLTIGDRRGQFPGMLDSRTFRIVLVAENHGAGINPENQPDKSIQYSGKQVSVVP